MILIRSGAVGVGWIVWRGQEYLPKELIFELHYLGAVSPIVPVPATALLIPPRLTTRST
jgi:glutamate/tyrosine decarboxylase-like PLP-dependent enzyme